MILAGVVRRPRVWVIVVCFVASLILSGCAGTGPQDDSGTKPAPDSPRDGRSGEDGSNNDYGMPDNDRRGRGDPSLGGPSVSEESDGLALVFEVDRNRYEQKQPVSLLLVAVNDSSREIDLKFPSAKRHDFIVKDDQGRVVWEWSAGQAFAQAIVERRLSPGQGLTSAAVWDQRTSDNGPVKPGKYEIEAEFPAIGHQKKMGPLSIEITR